VPFTKETWIEGQLPADTAAEKNRIEQAIADLYNVVYAEDMAEVTTTATGAFADPTTGVAGPITPPLVIPTGGRFVDLQAECEAHHSTNNTDGIWFVVLFNKDSTGWVASPNTGYGTATAYGDTTTGGVVFGASMWFADGVYRPLRMGQARSPAADGTTSYIYPSATTLFLNAGSWRFKLGYGLKSGGSGTAYFRTRRLRAHMLPN
jgi:hypothetical protein